MLPELAKMAAFSDLATVAKED